MNPGILHNNAKWDYDDEISLELQFAVNQFIKNSITTLGYCIPEKSNKYDRKAVALYSHDGTKVGYIFKTEQEDYYDACDKTSAYPCILSVNENHPKAKHKFIGTVYVFPNNDESVPKIIEEYI